MAAITYPFDEADAQDAFEEWGANCGPVSLAFALQVPLESVRYAIPGFDEKRYTSPTMMKAALANLGKTFTAMHHADTGKPTKETMFGRGMNLVRLQWTGPWTAPGANPKWAYRQSHWIACWKDPGQFRRVFDVNGGVQIFALWEQEVVPLITASYPRADGGWFPTHVWRVG